MRKQEKIVAITSFPPKRSVHGDGMVGIASYAKNTLLALRHANKNSNIYVEVLAEELPNETGYSESKVSVKRTWRRNSLRIFPKLLKEIFTNHKDSKTVLIEFELSMFGSLLCLLPFPLFLIILKILGKRLIFVMHQVIPDMDQIAPHINLKEESFKTDVLNALLKAFYTLVLLASSKVIVFEQDLKERLSALGIGDQNKKIVVIPHGVEEFKKTPTKEAARRKLGISKKSFVILSFGFIAWYKGTDWLIHAINETKKKRDLDKNDIQLVLAGGPNPNHENKEYYRRYIRGIIKECQKNDIILTGFVQERDIPLYFKACDLVVLPYRIFMSSSGPLSIAFSFKKPFLLSPKLKGILESEDLKLLLSQLKLKEKDIIFRDFNGDFDKKIIRLKKSAHLRQRLTRLSSEAKKARSWDTIGKRYYKELIN